MYAFTFQDKTFTPDGRANESVSADPAKFNATVESAEIDAIKAGADKLFLYIGKKPIIAERPDHQGYCVQTWLGTWLGWAWIGSKRYVGFGRNTYRRAVTVRMFGVLYNGWFYESSGDYCRLKKAKRQDVKYVVTMELF